MRVQILEAADLTQDALALHQPVIGELPHGLGVGNILGPNAGEPFAHGSQAAVDGDEEQADLPAPQFLEINDVQTSALLRHPRFALSDLDDGLQQVAIPLQGTVGDVEMRIND